MENVYSWFISSPSEVISLQQVARAPFPARGGSSSGNESSCVRFCPEQTHTHWEWMSIWPGGFREKEGGRGVQRLLSTLQTEFMTRLLRNLRDSRVQLKDVKQFIRVAHHRCMRKYVSDSALSGFDMPWRESKCWTSSFMFYVILCQQCITGVTEADTDKKHFIIFFYAHGSGYVIHLLSRLFAHHHHIFKCYRRFHTKYFAVLSQ